MSITNPTVNAASYLDVDNEDATPKVGTTVQSGWDSADALLRQDTTEFPTDFKFSEEPQLIKFLEDGPFRVYEQHWIERTGKKSFVALETDDPFTDLLGSKPRARFAFNVIALSGDTHTVQILTAPPSFARQIRRAHEDERKGPLSKEFWEVSRMGNGPTTQYTLNYVRGRDLEEEWNLSLESVNAIIKDAVCFTPDVIKETPREEMLKIAREVAGA